MSPFANYFIITSMMGLIGCGALYEARQERLEFEQALLKIYEDEVGLREYTRSLAYQIEDLRSKKYAKYSRDGEW